MIDQQKPSDSPTSASDNDGYVYRPPLASESYVPRTMPNVLGHRDMFLMYVSALFLLTNAVLGASGGAVSLVYLTIGAVIFFVPSVIVATQLGVLLPHEGAVYNWTYHALGAYWSVFVALLYWVTGVLAIITGCDAFVTILQGLNNTWLPEPWQQGLVILGILLVATLVCLQRMRTTQNIINGIALATMVSAALIITGAFAWIFRGYPVQTDFVHSSSWSINPGNFFFFGIITLNFIGTSGPLTMAGEFRGAGENQVVQRSIILRHLRWGSLCVFALYFLVSLAILIVRGQAMGTAAILPFEAFTAVDVSLGKWVGNIATCGFLSYCFASSIFYSATSSRLLMVAGIDRRLPLWFARLNKARAPKNAILFQSTFTAAVVIIVFIVSPYIARVGGSSANTLVVIYNVISAALTLVWTLATLFFFINLLFLYRHSAKFLRQRLAFPTPILWLSIVVGSLACLLTIAGILTYSWIPTLIKNNQWWIFVGGLAIAVIVVAAIGGLIASSEAAWEDTSSDTGL